MFRFEKLEIWQDSRKLVIKVYKLTKKFPVEEKFCLIDQIRRAAISISLNIAEGSDRKSDKEFKRFLRMAIASAEEVVTGFYLSLDLEYINQQEFDNIYEELNIIVAKINALVKKLDQ
jgi:four helix bundle protein